MCALADKSESRRLTNAETSDFDKAERQVKILDAQLADARNAAPEFETRGSGAERHETPDVNIIGGAGRSTTIGTRAVRGVEKEILRPDQSFAEWTNARGMGVSESRSAAHGFDWNSYWTARFHGQANAETRAVTGMGEDVSSGSGAGAGAVGQVWSAEVYDLVRARTFSHALGASTMPLMTEITNHPQFLADVAPAWVGEGTATAGDVSPSVGTIQFNAAGAFLDMAPISNNLIDDAIVTGGIDALIRNSISQKYARLIDQVLIYGQTGNAGNPGLANESGLLTQNASGAPTTYLPISQAAALVRGQSVEPSGWVWHPGNQAEFAQLKDTLNQPMRMTPDIADIPNVPSALLNYQVESGTAFTGGSASSLYLGDWSYVVIGMRTDGIQTRMLTERLAEFNQTAFFSSSRFSIRTIWPGKAMCRLYGIA
jgi:HK97 family phage major capsid protein